MEYLSSFLPLSKISLNKNAEVVQRGSYLCTRIEEKSIEELQALLEEEY